MKKWFFVTILLLINIAIIIYVLSINYVTFAQIYPENISFDVSNYISVRNAIIKSYYTALEKGRDIFANGSFTLAWLVMLNFLVTVFLTAKCCKTHNKY